MTESNPAASALHVLSPASETSAPDLSVVIVAYRARSVVLACLDTLVSHGGLDGLDAEVIVVDNASDDGTAEMVRSHFPGVLLIANAENAGFARANNQGLRVATGRHVLLLNPDTLVPRGALRACVDFLDAQDESVAAMSCRVLSPDGSLQWTCSRRLVTPWSECCRALLLDRAFARVDLFNREPELRWDRSVTREVECLLGAFMLVRRAALETIGGLDERFFLMYEDVDWCKRARDARYRLLFWPGASITHLGGASWKQEPVLTFANSHVSAVQYFRKHHPGSVGVVLFVSRLGMALKEGLLRLSLLRKPGDEYTVRHLAMARAAREALRTGSAGRRAKWIDPAPGEGAQA